MELLAACNPECCAPMHSALLIVDAPKLGQLTSTLHCNWGTRHRTGCMAGSGCAYLVWPWCPTRTRMPAGAQRRSPACHQRQSLQHAPCRPPASAPVLPISVNEGACGLHADAFTARPSVHAQRGLQQAAPIQLMHSPDLTPVIGVKREEGGPSPSANVARVGVAPFMSRACCCRALRAAWPASASCISLQDHTSTLAVSAAA